MGRPPAVRRPPILRHPKVETSEVAPPRHLRDEAHVYWHEAIGHLRQMGILTAVDLGTVERYSMLRFQVAECHRLEVQHGQYQIEMKQDEDGNEVIKKSTIHPWTVQLKQLAPLLLRIESEWGFTPATRQAVTKDVYAGDTGSEPSLSDFVAGATFSGVERRA